MAFSKALRAFQPLRNSILRTPAPASQLLPRPTFFQRSIATTSPRFNEQQSEQQLQQEQQPVEQANTSPEVSSSTTAESSVKTEVPPSLRQYAYTLKKGTVTAAGRMERTVTVMHSNTEWDSHLRKYYPKKELIKVADPRESLRVGDVIEFSSGFPKSRNVRHVVTRIITPFGTPIEDRPAVLTREELDIERAAKRSAKWQRKEARIRAGGGKAKPQQPSGEHIGRIRKLIHERRDSPVPRLWSEAAETTPAAEDAPASETTKN
ncbi:nucleic acid-binding protein [Aspergillus saccharolyticus JOP 1030-1]|uniref:Nucleic acid-binding protein n=1 Tax=Aspergillus saccharolyticus JOP 1030-1 TaxID=1450539 RepID=A0A319A429_9EURO|nr:nucleic acid-binding protein [Aspergillus saccharolyticus JOP 1030-1]PYH46878.1 nucleic acid-binding protein [Aspergillus saccharolyticus JOP 1030-1]